MVDGLDIKDGRLINNRRDPELGLSKAARLRREFKSSRAIKDIAEGIELAEQRKEMRVNATIDIDFFKKKKK